MSEDRISELRQKIDQLDDDILDLLRQRMQISAEVSQAKTDKTAIFRPGREAKMFATLAKKSTDLPFHFVGCLWRVIVSASIGLQKPDFTIATSQQALSDAIGLGAGQLNLAPAVYSPAQLIDMLAQAQADIAVIDAAELLEIAPLLARSDGVHIIASLSPDNPQDGQYSSYVLSLQQADRTEKDVAVLFDGKKNEIVLCSFDAYQEMDESDLDFLGFFAQFDS